MKAFRFVLAGVLLLAALPAAAQSTTGTITGRALDTSGGLLPGVDVSVSSPAMIGGARQAVTDAYLLAWQDGAFQGNNVTDSLRQQASTQATTSSPATTTSALTSAGPSCATSCGSTRPMATTTPAC